MITCKPLHTAPELANLHRIFSDAFEGTYTSDDLLLERILNNPYSRIYGAYEDNALVGGVVGFVLTPSTGKLELFIYDIAVQPSKQRLGYGAKLIEYTCSQAAKEGIDLVFVEADGDDPEAILFYRRCGGKELAVNQFIFSQ